MVSPLRKYIAKIFIFLSLLALPSCSKKWDETCKTQVYFECSSSTSSLINISNVEFNVTAFSISGQRMQGEGFSVGTDNLEANLKPIIEPGNQKLFTSFDVPQGTYTSFNFEYTLNAISSAPALLINADYTYEDEEGEEETIPLIIRLNEPFILTKAMYDNEANWIAGETYPMYLSFDLNYLTGGITQEMLDVAIEESEDNIEINETNNTAIYNALKERVISAFTMHF